MENFLKWVEIDKKALLHNVKEFKKKISSNPSENVKMYAVIKSNAYGHGLLEVADIIKNEVYGFAVNSLEEALILRKSGIENPILVLGYILIDELEKAVDNNITICVYNKETIDELVNVLQKSSGNKKCKVHIKIDTGLSRQGIFPKDVLKFINYIKTFPQIEIEGIYTHYANIEDTTDPSYAILQLSRFEKIVKLLKENNINIPIKHTACTAAIMLYPQTYFNAVRVGIGLYGLWPSEQTRNSLIENGKSNIKLKPVITWKTRVAQVKWISKDTAIAYGLTFRTSKKTKIAILPVGYSDGYDRELSNNSYVLIKNVRCPVLGRVMMNMIVIDVTNVENVKVEDEVILLGGNGISAEEMAKRLGTLNYEVVTRICWDLPRVVVGKF